MNILSIQSAVAYGRVGNSAAMFPLETLGHTVWPVDTVSFSNHPAFGSWRGRVNDPVAIAEIIEGVAERGAFARCDAVLSGYLGAAATGEVVIDTVARVKRANPDALFVLDPVMGDESKGLYVSKGIPALFREKALGAADIALPNGFELGVLTDREVTGVADAVAAAGALRAMGPGLVVVTGIVDGPNIVTILVGDGPALAVTTPTIDVPSHGAGDVFAALFLGHILDGGDAGDALGRAVSSIYAILRTTRKTAADALAIVAAREEILHPGERFTAQPLPGT